MLFVVVLLDYSTEDFGEHSVEYCKNFVVFSWVGLVVDLFLFIN